MYFIYLFLRIPKYMVGRITSEWLSGHQNSTHAFRYNNSIDRYCKFGLISHHSCLSPVTFRQDKLFINSFLSCFHTYLIFNNIYIYIYFQSQSFYISSFFSRCFGCLPLTSGFESNLIKRLSLNRTLQILFSIPA